MTGLRIFQVQMRKDWQRIPDLKLSSSVFFCHKSFFGQIGLDDHMDRFHPDAIDHREKIPPGPAAVQAPGGAVAGTSASASGVSASKSGKKQKKIAERNDKCLICDKAFRSRKELKRHEATGVHKKKLKEIKVSKARDEAVPGSSTSATVAKGPKKIAGRNDICEVCSKAYRSRKELERHEETAIHKRMVLQMQMKEQ